MALVDHRASIVRHYGAPELVARILSRLAAAGKDPQRLTREDLATFDEFHTGGRRSTRALAEVAGVARGMRVLDVGSGVGGPARTLAAEFGAQVVGIDLTEAFCHAARELTVRVGMAGLTTFICADATSLPLAASWADVVWSQNTIMNISDKGSLFAEVRRVLRPGGRFAFEAVLEGPVTPMHYPSFWASGPSLNFLTTPDETRRLLADAGLAEERWDDTTAASLDGARTRLAAAAPAAPSSLGRDVIVAEDVAAKVANSVRNSEEGRTLTVRAVFRRR